MNIQSCSQNGTIIFKSKSILDVSSGHQIIRCTLSPQLERQLSQHARQRSGKEENIRWLAIGDRVKLSTADGVRWQIDAVHPRRSLLARRAASAKDFGYTQEQVIAANVDQFVAVLAITQPEIKWNLLDRYLALAESAGLEVLICLTKLDLLESMPLQSRREFHARLEVYHALGYETMMTSSASGDGIAELKQHLHDRLSIFLGKSGVGKTSLLGQIVPGFHDRVNAVNPVTGKGRHTTTALSLIPLDEDSGVIDTPGTREFGMWDIEPDELAEYFIEMRPFLGRCKFRLDCRHDEEPGCAIRQAVMSGEISPHRYKSYRLLKEELR